MFLTERKKKQKHELKKRNREHARTEQRKKKKKKATNLLQKSDRFLIKRIQYIPRDTHKAEG